MRADELLVRIWAPPPPRKSRAEDGPGGLSELASVEAAPGEPRARRRVPVFAGLWAALADNAREIQVRYEQRQPHRWMARPEAWMCRRLHRMVSDQLAQYVEPSPYRRGHYRDLLEVLGGLQDPTCARPPPEQSEGDLALAWQRARRCAEGLQPPPPAQLDLIA